MSLYPDAIEIASVYICHQTHPLFASQHKTAMYSFNDNDGMHYDCDEYIEYICNANDSDGVIKNETVLHGSMIMTSKVFS